jgi:hypothetical protein
MENKNIENPTYKNEDLSAKNEKELNLAKLKAKVESNKQALEDVFDHALETGDDNLAKGCVGMLEEAGIAEYLIKLKEGKIGKDEQNKNENFEESAENQELIEEKSTELSQGDEKEYIRIKKRIIRLGQLSGNSIDEAITQVELEKEIEKRGKPKIPFVESRGGVEKVIRNPEDIFYLLH